MLNRMANKIGIKIRDTKPNNMDRVKGRCEHCSFVGLARSGQRFYAQNEDISCSLARYNLGLDDPTEATMRTLARTLVGWADAETEEIGLKYLRGRLKLPYGEKYILYFPMPDRDYEPDVVVLIGPPSKLMAKVRETTYRTGVPADGFSSGVGAMCGECTAYPILTGKTNISLGCTGSRPRTKLKPDEMFLAIPYKESSEW